MNKNQLPSILFPRLLANDAIFGVKPSGCSALLFVHLTFICIMSLLILVFFLTETPIEKTLRASIAQIGIILLFSDEMDTSNSSIPLSLIKDMRSSEMFSSCLSPAHFEQLMISPATVSSLSMHHLEYKCQNIHLDLETYPKNLRLEASIGHMRFDEYYSTEKHDSGRVDKRSMIGCSSSAVNEVASALPEQSTGRSTALPPQPLLCVDDERRRRLPSCFSMTAKVTLECVPSRGGCKPPFCSAAGGLLVRPGGGVKQTQGGCGPARRKFMADNWCSPRSLQCVPVCFERDYRRPCNL